MDIDQVATSDKQSSGDVPWNIVMLVVAILAVAVGFPSCLAYMSWGQGRQWLCRMWTRVFDKPTRDTGLDSIVRRSVREAPGPVHYIHGIPSWEYYAAAGRDPVHIREHRVIYEWRETTSPPRSRP